MSGSFILIFATSCVFLLESNIFSFFLYLDRLTPLEIAVLIFTKFFLHEFLDTSYDSIGLIELSSGSKAWYISLDTVLSLTDCYIYELMLYKFYSYISYGVGWSIVTFWYRLTLKPSLDFIWSYFILENFAGDEFLFLINLFSPLGFFFLFINGPSSSICLPLEY